jgi:hypothetical protein
VDAQGTIKRDDIDLKGGARPCPARSARIRDSHG